VFTTVYLSRVTRLLSVFVYCSQYFSTSISNFDISSPLISGRSKNVLMIFFNKAFLNSSDSDILHFLANVSINFNLFVPLM